MSGFWTKKAADMTIADTFKFTGIMTVASVAICAIPLVIENRDEIKEWISDKFKRKEVKPTLSEEEEEEDDWGV